MKKLRAIIVGFILALLVIIGFNLYLNFQIKSHKEAFRNSRDHQRFWSSEAQKFVMDENTLPIFGSSELMPVLDYKERVCNFLNSDDMNVLTIGEGNFQSLSHAMTLGAISDAIYSKKVALFLSPQWFTSSGATTGFFPSKFGEDTLLTFLDNNNISKKNKEYVLNRTIDLLSESPTQRARVLKYKSGYENESILNGIYTSVMRNFWKFRQKYQAYINIKDLNEKVPKVDLKNMDYSKMLQLAEEQGEKASTNNDLGIYNEYWDTYVKSVYEKGEVKEKQQVFTDSPEYEDLRCFLDIAKELGIKVLMVNIPVNEKWYTFQGMLCDEYYKKIVNISKDYDNVVLIDMSEYGKEKYFHKDIMHLGWKGWTRINEALYKEFKK